MHKSSFPIAFGMLLLVGLAGAAPGRAATLAIPEVSTNRVIEVVRSKSAEKTPVISSVAIDPAGKLLAVVGDDHVVRLFDVPDRQAIVSPHLSLRLG